MKSACDNPFSQRKAGPKTLKSISVSRSADGGYLMQHQHDGYDHAPETHSAKTGAQMIAHLSKHMGVKGEK